MCLALFLERQRTDLLPGRQHVEGQVGLQREDGVDRTRRALAEHAPARGVDLFDCFSLALPGRRVFALFGRDQTEHDGALVGQREMLHARQEGVVHGAVQHIGASLEDAGIEFAHRRDDALDFFPGGDTAGDRRAIGCQVRMRARGGEAHGTGLEPLLYQARHAVNFFIGGRVSHRAPAHHVHADRRMADVHRVVQRLGSALDRGHVFGEGFPGPVDAGFHRIGRDVLDIGQAVRHPLAVGWFAGRQREAAVAHHHRGHAVVARAAAHRIPHDLRVHVGVAVDEAGRDDQPVGIDGALGRVGDAADLRNAAVRDADIRGEALAARTVNDGAAAYQQVQGHGLLRLASGLEARPILLPVQNISCC